MATGTLFPPRESRPDPLHRPAVVTGYQPLLLATGLGTLLVGTLGLFVTDGEPGTFEDSTVH